MTLPFHAYAQSGWVFDSINNIVNTVDTSTRLGIGATPLEKLHVGGDVIIEGLRTQSSNDSLGDLVKVDSMGRLVPQPVSDLITTIEELVWGGDRPLASATCFLSCPDDPPEWRYNGCAIYTCPLDAKVGIGTETPAAKLDVIGDIRLEATNAQAGYVIGNNSPYIYAAASSFPGGVSGTMFGSLVLQSRSSASRPILFVTGQIPQERMRVHSNGNVGIGTTSPRKALDVRGTIVADHADICGPIWGEEVIVELGFNPCDFVFEDDYLLMPLKELEAFIGANKHLPEIPSAAEMEQNGGVALGEMQSKQLQKIEELTLYTIAQQKQIDQLEKRLEKLEAPGVRNQNGIPLKGGLGVMVLLLLLGGWWMMNRKLKSK